MNLKFLIILLTIAANTAFSQVTYTISPASSVNLTVLFNQTTASKIYQVNTGGSKILLKWERVSVNLPFGWTYTSCDNGFCYGGIPIGPNVMDSVPVGGQGMVGLDIDPENIQGTGVVKIYVYQDGYRNNGDTLTWNISLSTVGIEEINENSGISVFPNPTDKLLNIKLTNKFKQKVESIFFIDALGRKVKEVDFFDEGTVVDISDLKSGYYNLVVKTSSEQLFKRVVKLN